MYDYEKEEIAKEGGDIDDLISIIIIDLHDIHPSFVLLSSLFYLTISKKPPQGEVLYKL